MPRPILHVVGPSIAYVELTQGQYSVIESEDASLVGNYSWGFRVVERGKIVIRANVRVNGSAKMVAIHRFIMGLDNPLSVDHKNGNRLDNRRHGNLRFANHQQQMWNRRGMRTDWPKGVSPSTGGKWRARIRVNGKKVHVGLANTMEEAGEMYRLAAIKHFGDFARA